MEINCFKILKDGLNPCNAKLKRTDLGPDQSLLPLVTKVAKYLCKKWVTEHLLSEVAYF